MKNPNRSAPLVYLRVLLSVLFLIATFVNSTPRVRAQTPPARSTKCNYLKERIRAAADDLGPKRSERERIRKALPDMDIGIFREPGRISDEKRQAQQREKELTELIDEGEKEFDVLLEQLANCRCPEKPKTDEAPDVPGLDDEVGEVPVKRNEVAGLFSVVREDSTPRFNTYGVNGFYTHYITTTWGTTLDVNAHFRDRNGADLSKFAVLGGVTMLPFNGVKTADRVSTPFHFLAGVAHFRSKTGTTRFSQTAFTLKLGVALDFNATGNLFIRPFQFDYAPTFFGGATQHNFQFGSGLGFRF